MSGTDELRSREKELKAALAPLVSENEGIIGSKPMQTVNGVATLMVDEKSASNFQSNAVKMRQIRSELKDVADLIEAKEYGERPSSVSQAVQAYAGTSSTERKSLGEMFTDSPEFKEMVASGGAQMRAPWQAKGVKDMGAMFSPEKKDVYTSLPSGAIPLGFAPIQREPIVVQPFRRTRVRDLFPVQTTVSAVIEFFRVINFVASNAASTVAQRDTTVSPNVFGLKPHTALSFEGLQAPVRTIAHYEAAHRNVLNDVPQLNGIIDTELLYGLRLAEDNQILNGAGTGNDLLGLLNTPNIQSYGRGGVTSDTKADDIRRAATLAILAYYEPTGVVMHPHDWESIELLKDTTGAYIVAIAVAVGGEQRIWRLPVVDTPAINVGTALVGSFGLGAKLYDREEGNVRIAEQHADFFLRNAIVVLAEERLALTCARPESFVKVTFGS